MTVLNVQTWFASGLTAGVIATALFSLVGAIIGRVAKPSKGDF